MKKSILVLVHLPFWIFTSLLVILAIQLLSIPASILGGGGPSISKQFSALLIVLPIGASIFYASYFSLPFFVKKTTRLIWLSIGYIVFILILGLIDYHDSKHIDFFGLFLVLLPVFYFNGFGFLFRTFIEWIKDRKIKAELEKDKVTSQLELLKSQINPHFLFNTLNNIDVLIQDEPVKASAFLKKLSEILRFMLYESSANKILLAKEIEYIQKYIELQKIRTSNENFVKFEISGDISNKYISPMLLIHFIENAFKYATNKKIEEAITIRFGISEMRLSFFCKNHVYATDGVNREKNGLGIYLLKQKLDLLYKRDYTLNTKEEDNWYIVNLEIPLDDH